MEFTKGLKGRSQYSHDHNSTVFTHVICFEGNLEGNFDTCAHVRRLTVCHQNPNTDILSIIRNTQIKVESNKAFLSMIYVAAVENQPTGTEAPFTNMG